MQGLFTQKATPAPTQELHPAFARIGGHTSDHTYQVVAPLMPKPAASTY